MGLREFGKVPSRRRTTVAESESPPDMDVSLWAVVLLFAAVLLLFAEILIPSGGIIFAVSMCCLCLSVLSAWNAWWDKYPLFWWSYLTSVIILFPTTVGAAIYVWPHTPIGKMSEPPTQEEVTPYAEEQKRLERLVGQIGETLTPQNPAGLTRVDGQRVHSLSEGMVIPIGEAVRVLAVRGNRILVRRVIAGENLASDSEPRTTETPNDDLENSPLDFDLPG